MNYSMFCSECGLPAVYPNGWTTERPSCALHPKAIFYRLVKGRVVVPGRLRRG